MRFPFLSLTCLLLSTSAFGQGGDTCALAEDVMSMMSFPYDNTAAVTSGDAGLCYTVPASASGDFHQDVWFEWTAPASGMFTASNNGIDGLLGVFDGNDCATAMIVECNDSVAMADVVNWPATAGSSYLICLAGWNATTTGTGTIDIMQVGGPPAVGVNYCTNSANSSGSASAISASGSNSVAANDLVLSAGPGPAGEPGVFFYGPTALMPLPFGNGFRCVGGTMGTVVRVFPFVVADGAGTMSTSIDNTNPVHSQMQSGATLHFQCWFRDPAGGGTGFDLSDGYTILFSN